jgi:phage baseplate assembly protein W
MSKVVKNTPIGLALPIRNGSQSGYFDQTFDTFSAARMNIINLIRTKPMERRMQPSLGCRLWNELFEPNDHLLPEKVSRIVREDISRWIPGVTVKDVEVKQYLTDKSENPQDIYNLYIAVNFSLNGIDHSDVVEIVLDVGKI